MIIASLALLLVNQLSLVFHSILRKGYVPRKSPHSFQKTVPLFLFGRTTIFFLFSFAKSFLSTPGTTRRFLKPKGTKKTGGPPRPSRAYYPGLVVDNQPLFYALKPPPCAAARPDGAPSCAAESAGVQLALPPVSPRRRGPPPCRRSLYAGCTVTV